MSPLRCLFVDGPLLFDAVHGAEEKWEGSRLSLDIDESSEKSVQQQIFEALRANAVRVMDLFRDWDDDNTGTISKKEFRSAMRELGLNVPREQIELLFSDFDPDGSGKIEFVELNKQLRGGVINRTSPANGTVATQAGLEGARSVSRSCSKKLRASPTILERLKDELVQQGVRYTDMLSLYDDDQDGRVTKQQWRRALCHSLQTGQASDLRF